jgi:hypothetical protein
MTDEQLADIIGYLAAIVEKLNEIERILNK